MQADAPPGMLRGLLTLTLAKPTRISSIEIELVGKTSTAWPEVAEEHEIYSQSYVLFRAGSESPYRNNRRTLSVGPGLSLDHDEDERSEESSEDHHVQERHGSIHSPIRTERRGRDPGPPPAVFNRGSRRHQSVDQSTFQRDYVLHRDNGRVQPLSLNNAVPHSPSYSEDAAPQYSVTPSTLSPTASVSHRMHTVEESPIQESATDINEFGRSSAPDTERSSLTSVHHVRPMLHMHRSSSSSLRLDSPQPYSARQSFDEDRPPEFIAGSSSSPLPGRSSSRLATLRQREPSRSSEQREVDDGRGRKHKRFSLANVSNALLDVVMDRMRSRSRSAAVDRKPGDDTPPRGRPRERMDAAEEEEEEGNRRERSTLGRVSELVGLDLDDDKEYGDGWKEFRKGVYTYPISFAIPATSPPTLRCDFGSVIWKLKAYAHRPGAFTTKLSASQEITVVACPSEDDIEETDSIIVERQWDTQMQYLITVSGRSFPIGGIMPISITFMPWTKMKVYRVSVLLEERVDYWTDFKRIARTDPITRLPLLALRHTQKDGPPILPYNPDEMQAFMRSPFAETLPPGEDVGEYASSLMGPGPWRIRKDIQLPDLCTQLHFTNRNKRSNIFVTHTLKIVFRVERGDDQAVDPHTGKRKLFDIVVQTPIHILSCLCNQEYLSLPPYSRALEMPSPYHAGCNYITPNGSVAQRPADRSAQSSFTALHPSTEPPPASATIPEHSHNHHHLTPPPLSRQNSIFERGTQFERLVAGQESELGEAPPAYEEVAPSTA